jgi:hypothetical protein
VRPLVFALVVLALAPSAAAQDWTYSERDRAREEARQAREQAREEAREAREQAREARREAREAANEARRESWEISRGDGRDGVHLRLLRSYHLPAGSVSREPIVVVGGSATIDGRAEDDVVVIGGTLRVGPQAVILGDAVSVGGELIVDPAAIIDGQVDETVVDWPDFDVGWAGVPGGWWAAASFGAMTLRLALVLIVSLLLTWLAPGWTGGIGQRVSDAPAASLFLGLTSQLLFVPALVLLCVILVISIVGIPLLLALPFLLAFAALAWTAGFAGVASRLGARLRGQRPGTSTSPTLDLVVGFASVTAVTVVAHVLAVGPWWTRPVWMPIMVTGWAIEWLVWTLGLGAMLTSFVGRRSDAPPAIPIIPQPAPSGM